jgi:threonylcarbamoyladenosine tRNA methylthiotransferase MtaB
MGGFQRLRLSSIEPWDFEPDLLSLWQDDRLCRHFHIPLQSGDDEILKAMGRPITTNDYRALVEGIQTKVTGSAITTDVITGFPGEGDEFFERSHAFIRSIGFAGGHVFTFSPRPGTAAAKMKAQVPFQVAKKRNQVLRKTFKEQGAAFRNQFVGTTLPVLWESSEEMAEGSFQLSGLTDNYIRVFAQCNRDLWNEISDVNLLETHSDRNALQGIIHQCI